MVQNELRVGMSTHDAFEPIELSPRQHTNRKIETDAAARQIASMPTSSSAGSLTTGQHHSCGHDARLGRPLDDLVTGTFAEKVERLAQRNPVSMPPRWISIT